MRCQNSQIQVPHCGTNKGHNLSLSAKNSKTRWKKENNSILYNIKSKCRMLKFQPHYATDNWAFSVS